jgi:hypothetical protein
VTKAWRAALRGDPLPWLLQRDDPAIRHLALTQLLDEPEDARPPFGAPGPPRCGPTP